MHCLEEISIHKREAKDYRGLSRDLILTRHLIKQDARMYENHVESLREASDCQKNRKEILVIPQVRAII